MGELAWPTAAALRSLDAAGLCAAVGVARSSPHHPIVKLGKLSSRRRSDYDQQHISVKRMMWHRVHPALVGRAKGRTN